MTPRTYHAPIPPTASEKEQNLSVDKVVHELEHLRSDLAQLATSLEERGRIESADVAVAAALRVNEVLAVLPSARI